MRLFTAVDLPAVVRERMAALQAPDVLDARWAPPEQFHVTLRFIGDAAPPEASRYEEALRRLEVPPADCVPYGLDVLPSRRNPRVLVVGLERTDDLMALYRAVSEALEGEGLDPESRTYRPHVTLARLNDVPAPTVHDVLDAHAEVSLPSFTADTVYLYESTLTPDGARHERRASIPLGA
jgi:2'-5' RNA ligase